MHSKKESSHGWEGNENTEIEKQPEGGKMQECIFNAYIVLKFLDRNK
ncbi:hypothetical protein [Zunongwangia sp. HRR-M8]|nr:hypothetical protein [Zunongwangia sp. HRR-M8]WBL22721.1 hypothetical protein PBT89_01890 [Zunongwangia sp. HRR-M8]